MNTTILAPINFLMLPSPFDKLLRKTKNSFSSRLLLAGPRLNQQRCELNILFNRFVLYRVSHKKVCIVQGVP